MLVHTIVITYLEKSSRGLVYVVPFHPTEWKHRLKRKGNSIDISFYHNELRPHVDIDTCHLPAHLEHALVRQT